MLFSKLRFEPAVERCVVEEFIEQKRCIRVFQRTRTIRNHRVKIGEELVLVQELRLDAQAAAHEIEFIELFAEVLEYVLRLRHFLLASFDDKLFEFLLPIFRREKEKCRIEMGFVVHTAREETAAFRVNAARHFIRKGVCRLVGGGRNALRLKVKCAVGLHRCDGRLHAIGDDGELLLHGGVEVGPAIPPRRKKRSVLVDADSNGAVCDGDTGDAPERHDVGEAIHPPPKEIKSVHILPPLLSLR